MRTTWSLLSFMYSCVDYLCWTLLTTCKNVVNACFRRWKVKCKKLEKQLTLFRSSAEQATSRCEQLSKELEATRAQASLSAQQLEHAKREFNALLVRSQPCSESFLCSILCNVLVFVNCVSFCFIEFWHVAGDSSSTRRRSPSERYSSVFSQKIITMLIHYLLFSSYHLCQFMVLVLSRGVC